MYVVGSGRGGRCWGEWVQDWVWEVLEEHGESGICVCVLVAVVWVGQGLGGYCGIMSVCVVSLDYLC